MNKQTLFMVAASCIGVFGAFFVEPFYGFAVYSLFAVLRPDGIWQWALPMAAGWSKYVALATILALLLQGGRRQPEPVEAIVDGRHGYFEIELPPIWRMAHIFVLLYLVWCFLSYVVAVANDTFLNDGARMTSERLLTDLAKIIIMYVAGCYLVQNAKEIRVIYWIAVWSLLYISYEMNFFYFVNRRLTIYHQGYAGLDNNGAGLMLAMAAPLCYFAWEGCRRWWGWAALFGIPLVLHAVLMSYSRGAMVSLLGITPLLVWRSRLRWMLVPALALTFAVALPIMAGPEIRARFFSISKVERDKSAQSRFASWRAAWDMSRDYPVFGVGFRNSPSYTYAYGGDVEGRVIHNTYLQISADCGFVGLFIFLGILVCTFFCLWSAFRRLRYCDPNDPEVASLRAMASGVECALAAYCLGSIFLSLQTFELPYLLTLLAVQCDQSARALPVAADPAEDQGFALHPGWDQDGYHPEVYADPHALTHNAFIEPGYEHTDARRQEE